MLAHLKKTADGLGLPFGERPSTYNSRRAQELGKWAEEMGAGEPFHKAIYHAYFAEGKNIGQLDILVAAATGVGLDADETKQVIESGRYAARVDADWAKASELGVTAVPTCIYQEKALVGFQDYEAFQQLIQNTND